MSLVPAMALVLATWLLAIAAIYGLGCLLEGLAPRLVPNLPLARLWLGICFLLAALQWIHFFLPMNRWIAPAFLALGLASLLYALANKKLHFPQTLGNETLLIILAFFWLANRATGVATFWRANPDIGQWLPYDTGFYHASTLEWFAQFPVVPGLANLHGPLALNSASMLLAAALDRGFWFRTSHHINCGLWIVMYLASFVASFNRARNTTRPQQWPIAAFDAALLPLLLAWALGSNINGLATDPPAIILSFVCISACLRALLERPDPREARTLFFFALCLGITAITCKLIALVVIFFALTITFILLLSRATWPSPAKSFVALILPFLLILVPWLARNIIMSGYLIHPVPFTAIHVPWRQPLDLAIDQQAWIRSWSRIQNVPLDQTTGFQWIGPWSLDILQTHWADLLTPLALALLIAVFLYKTRRSSPQSALATHSLLLLLAPLAALAFWFWNAPDVRYGGFLAAMELGLIAAFLLHFLPTFKARQGIAVALLFYAVLIAAQQTTEFLRFFPHESLRKLFVYLPDDGSALLPMPAPACEQTTTPFGLAVYVPKQGNRVYAATLPAAPKVDPRLRLRYPPQFRWGFWMDESAKVKVNPR